MRRTVGQYLIRHPLRHGEQKRLAGLIGKSPRTLRTWRSRGGRTGSPGRPPHAVEARRLARELTESAWRALPRGHDGWRGVQALLERGGVRVPTRLVQESLREMKREAAERERTRIEANRVHVEVHARDALWALDQTEVLRDERGKLCALVVRECLAPRTLGVSLGPPACGEDVVRLLERTAEARGGWPLAIQLDNGPENKNATVRERLLRERVIAIWNEPRTPQHNPRAEHGIGTLKVATGVDGPAERVVAPSRGPVRPSDPGVPCTRAAACVRLLGAWEALDARTPRQSLGGRTPAELDRVADRADDLTNRARFYAQVREERRRIALARVDARARRKLEREAAWRALERHGLVTRTRGGRLLQTFKAEGIS